MGSFILNNKPVVFGTAGWDMSKIPQKSQFERGLQKPFILDLMFADKEFAPFHRDEPKKNGRKYHISVSAIEKHVNNGDFIGLPVFLYDPEKGDHGLGEKERKVIGIIHDAILAQDDKGKYVKVLGGIWANEIKEDVAYLEQNKEQMGASPEFGVLETEIDENGTIIDFDPKGALLLRKSEAAFKETQLYCSDVQRAGEATDIDKRVEEIPCEVPKQTKKPQTKGGCLMKGFCETCSPIAEQEFQKRVDVLRINLQEIAKSQKTVEEHQLELASVKSEAEKREKTWQEEIKKYQDKIVAFEQKQIERNKTDLEILALAKVREAFDKVKDKYLDNKHKEVEAIMFKIQCGTATLEDTSGLLQCQKPVGGGELLMAAAASKTPEGARTPEEIDAYIGVINDPVYKERKVIADKLLAQRGGSV